MLLFNSYPLSRLFIFLFSTCSCNFGKIKVIG